MCRIGDQGFISTWRGSCSRTGRIKVMVGKSDIWDLRFFFWFQSNQGVLVLSIPALFDLGQLKIEYSLALIPSFWMGVSYIGNTELFSMELRFVTRKSGKQWVYLLIQEMMLLKVTSVPTLGDSKGSRACCPPVLLSESQLVPEILFPFPGTDWGLECDETPDSEIQGEVSQPWETVEKVFCLRKARICLSLPLNRRQMLISHFH